MLPIVCVSLCSWQFFQLGHSLTLWLGQKELLLWYCMCYCLGSCGPMKFRRGWNQNTADQWSPCRLVWGATYINVWILSVQLLSLEILLGSNFVLIVFWNGWVNCCCFCLWLSSYMEKHQIQLFGRGHIGGIDIKVHVVT